MASFVSFGRIGGMGCVGSVIVFCFLLEERARMLIFILVDGEAFFWKTYL